MIECKEKPELLLGKPIGMYHCPECGNMVIAGIVHGPIICNYCTRELEGTDTEKKILYETGRGAECDNCTKLFAELAASEKNEDDI